MVLKTLPPSSPLTQQLRTRWWERTRMPRMGRPKRRRRRTRRKMRLVGRTPPMPTPGPRVKAAARPRPSLGARHPPPACRGRRAQLSPFDGFEVLFLLYFGKLAFMTIHMHSFCFSVKHNTFCVLKSYSIQDFCRMDKKKFFVSWSRP